METLKQFANDSHMLEDVKDYVIKSLEKQIITDAFAGNEVTYATKAKQSLQEAFSQLQADYKVKANKPIIDHTM